MIERHYRDLEDLNSYMKYYIDNILVGYKINFRDRESRTNKDGSLICNKFLIYKKKDTTNDKLNYLSNQYKDYLTIKDGKLIAKDV